MRQTQRFFFSFSSFSSSIVIIFCVYRHVERKFIVVQMKSFRWMFITWVTMLRAKYREFMCFDKFIPFLFFFIVSKNHFVCSKFIQFGKGIHLIWPESVTKYVKQHINSRQAFLGLWTFYCVFIFFHTSGSQQATAWKYAHTHSNLKTNKI